MEKLTLTARQREVAAWLATDRRHYMYNVSDMMWAPRGILGPELRIGCVRLKTLEKLQQEGLGEFLIGEFHATDKCRKMMK